MLEYLTWVTASISLASSSIFGDIKPVHEQLQVPQYLVSHSAKNRQTQIYYKIIPINQALLHMK